MKSVKGIAHFTLLLILCLISAGCSLLNQPPQQPISQQPVITPSSGITAPTNLPTTPSAVTSATTKIENAISNIATIANNTNTALQNISGTLSNTVNYGSAIVAALASIYGMIKGHQAYVQSTVAKQINNNGQKPS